MILLPGAMHTGRNLGRNVAEAANFVLDDHSQLLKSMEQDGGYTFRVCKRASCRRLYSRLLKCDMRMFEDITEKYSDRPSKKNQGKCQ